MEQDQEEKDQRQEEDEGIVRLEQVVKYIALMEQQFKQRELKYGERCNIHEAYRTLQEMKQMVNGENAEQHRTIPRHRKHTPYKIPEIDAEYLTMGEYKEGYSILYEDLVEHNAAVIDNVVTEHEGLASILSKYFKQLQENEQPDTRTRIELFLGEVEETCSPEAYKLYNHVYNNILQQLVGD